MNVQIISNSQLSFPSIKISKPDNVDTFDSYDVNIIDLSNEKIWEYDRDSYQCSNEETNLNSLKKMIDSSKKASFIFVLPQNINFKYCNTGNSFYRSIKMRDNIYGMALILSKILPFSFKLEYEPNKAMIGDKKVKSDFYFESTIDERTMEINAIDSGKILSFKFRNYIFTTLDVLKSGVVENFLNIYFKKGKSPERPEWFKEIAFYNDQQLNDSISENKKKIEKANENIEKAEQQLATNDYYKGLVVETGDELVERVFDVLIKIFPIDLSSFVDEKKEDFNYSLDGVAFVGEIKGVGEGVRNSHLAQLENNKQLLMEKNELQYAKGLLIINQQRKDSPLKREEVHINQVKYAQQHDLLIITTTTLLEIYQYYLQGLLDLNKLKNVFQNKNGLLKDEWK